MTVDAFQASNGVPLWTAPVTGFPAGASIVAVRAWPGYITVGVSFPRVAGGATARSEVIFSARTAGSSAGIPRPRTAARWRRAPRARSVVGPASVTSYNNNTGKALWSRPTGKVPQAWRVDQGQLYITVAAGGYLGNAPVTALRRISLKTGAERTIRPSGGSFAGTLSGAFDGVVLFSGSHGLAAYSGATGQLLWQLERARCPRTSTLNAASCTWRAAAR